ncbi:hypothetical protein HRI96_06215 [Treponema parvum]|uniref:DUF4352 domain-containing protein n=1 Tax=Treponema parvum TaxID=138851 RepID=A0A975F0I3_9SPIR|nr:hypothetical protein [Treponema parvum]QTQ11829.1 hypothetical protein HRI96_06215 [Treponema parvum]
MKRTLLVIISVCIFFAQAVFSQDSTPAATDLSHAGVSIRFYDRTMYYPNEAKTNPIYVHITIANRGPETLRFKLADNRLFSLSFRAFDVKNNQLPLSESLILARTTSQTVFYRDIALEAGEEYSFVENVKDYLQIKEPAIYYLEMEFFPELYKPVSASKLLSNRLTLEIRPSPSASASIVLPIQDKTTSILKPESISPDQIENTVYSPVEGSVSVIERFQNTGFKEKKRYTYHLRRRDGIWQIYKYNVDNLGRE